MYKPKLLNSCSAFAALTVTAFSLTSSFSMQAHAESKEEKKKTVTKIIQKKTENKKEDKEAVTATDENTDEEATTEASDELATLTPTEQKKLEDAKKTKEEKKEKDPLAKDKETEKKKKTLESVFEDVSAKTLDANGVSQNVHGLIVGLEGKGPKICWARVNAAEYTKAEKKDETKSKDKTVEDLKKNLKKNADEIAVRYRFDGTPKVPTLQACLDLHKDDEQVDLTDLENLKIDALNEHQVALLSVYEKSGKKAPLKNTAKSEDYLLLEKALKIDPGCYACGVEALATIKALDSSTNLVISEAETLIQSYLDQSRLKALEEWKTKNQDALAKLTRDAKNVNDLNEILNKVEDAHIDLSSEKNAFADTQKESGNKFLHDFLLKNVLTLPEKLVKTKGESTYATEYADVYARGLGDMASYAKDGSDEQKRALTLQDGYTKRSGAPEDSPRMGFLFKAEQLNRTNRLPQNDELKEQLPLQKAKWVSLQQDVSLYCPPEEKDNLSTECVKTIADAKAYSAWMGPIYMASISDVKNQALLDTRTAQLNALLDRRNPNAGFTAQNRSSGYSFANYWAPANSTAAPAAQNDPFNVNALLTPPSYTVPNYVDNLSGAPQMNRFAYPNFRQSNASNAAWGNPNYVQTESGWSRPVAGNS